MSNNHIKNTGFSILQTGLFTYLVGFVLVYSDVSIYYRKKWSSSDETLRMLSWVKTTTKLHIRYSHIYKHTNTRTTYISTHRKVKNTHTMFLLLLVAPSHQVMEYIGLLEKS